MFGFMKKKSEYVLDLDNASSNGAAKTEPAADKKSETVKETTAAKKSEAVKETTATKKSEAVKETAAKPIKSEPVKVPVASTNAKIATPAPILTTFAPSYLMPTPTTNRRLPGPNMDSFLNMARQVKKSK